MFRPFFILIATAACTFAQTKTAVAQVEQPEKSAANATEAEVREMVEKLGSPSFADRQQAAKDLLNGGPESVALLETLAAKAIGETKFRLQMILQQLHKRLFDDELEAFLKEPSVGNAERLPEWERFKSICGDNEDALSIFGEILTAEPRLFATRLFATPRDLSALLESRTAELAIKCNGRSDEEFPVASVAAVMLLGSDSETRLIRGTSTNISSALDDPRFSHLITDGIHAKTLRAIVESWIVRPGIAAERPLLFSMQHNLASGRIVAHRIIKEKSVRPDMIYSLLCLGRLNSTEDLPLIESLLDNNTVLWPNKIATPQPGQPPMNIVQTRDVALVAAVHLRGIAPADLGVDARMSETTLFAIDSIGFGNEQARDNAIAAYRRMTNGL